MTLLSGGPLCDGDIEEADGVLQVFCPWHDYNFNLKTGKSSTGLQVKHHLFNILTRMFQVQCKLSSTTFVVYMWYITTENYFNL